MRTKRAQSTVPGTVQRDSASAKFHRQHSATSLNSGEACTACRLNSEEGSSGRGIPVRSDQPICDRVHPEVTEAPSHSASALTSYSRRKIACKSSKLLGVFQPSPDFRSHRVEAEAISGLGVECDQLVTDLGLKKREASPVDWALHEMATYWLDRNALDTVLRPCASIILALHIFHEARRQERGRNSQHWSEEFLVIGLRLL